MLDIINNVFNLVADTLQALVNLPFSFADKLSSALSSN